MGTEPESAEMATAPSQRPAAPAQRSGSAVEREARSVAAAVRPGADGSTPPTVASLQRLVGNRATTELLRRNRGGGSAGAGATVTPDRQIVRRRNNAQPQSYAVAPQRVDNNTATLVSVSTWDSSTGTTADLSDVQTRERIDFGEDPRTKVPGYATLLGMDGRFTLAGNVLTKIGGNMGSGRAEDEHTGSAYGTKFTVNGVPNLMKPAPQGNGQPGSWTLTGTQTYEYALPTAPATWVAFPGAWTITRNLQWVNDHFELTQTKTGPGINQTAGPARIDFETTEAMASLTAARPNQDADWNRAHTMLTRAGLVTQQLRRVVHQVGPGRQMQVDYLEYQPGGPVDNTLQGAGGSAFIPPSAIQAEEKAALFGQAKEAIKTILDKALGPGGHAPPAFLEFRFYPASVAQVQQQSFVTATNGGTYIILLKGKDAAFATGQKDKMAQNQDTSIPGQVAKGGWTAAGKLERFCKATAIHEAGHMLHAKDAADIFLQATITPGAGNPIQPNNPLYPESVHVANVNQRVMQALAAAMTNAGGQWTYARANPAEVVAEGFTAMMADKDVPRPIAAVYVAYRGPRSTTIDQKLKKAFPNKAIPAMPQPESAIANM